ncbi:MAG: hypothetical protein ACXQT4_00380 [Methanotrichaceae archaeon]
MIGRRNDEKLKKGSRYTMKWTDPLTGEELEVEYTVDKVYENRTHDGSPGATVIIATGKVRSTAEGEKKKKAGGRKQHG